MKEGAKLHDELKGKRLALVSVSKDDDSADAARFMAKYKYSWLNVADPKWESDADWGESGIPRLVLIGKDGRMLFESEGFDEAQEAKIRASLHNMDPTFPAVDRGGSTVFSVRPSDCLLSLLEPTRRDASEFL